MKRTNLQNKSLHLAAHLLSGELNSNGLDMRVVLKPDYKIRWDKDSIKENIIKPVAKSMYGVESTTKLTTAQISRVWEEIMQMLVDKFPTMDWVDFPSQEQTQSYLDSYDKPSKKVH